MSRYPAAVWEPWAYPARAPAEHAGKATYYQGQNEPRAVVIHAMQGWASTALQWAQGGFYPKSWHFTIAFDGTVYQHLDFDDGGYHAGITDSHAARFPPTWPRWEGPGRNVNTYSIGIEGEGFSYIPYGKVTSNPAHLAYSRPEQRLALKKLCQWLASPASGIPIEYSKDFFPAHAEIDTVNRSEDPLPLPGRTELYQYLELIEGGDDDMDPRLEEMIWRAADILGFSPPADSVDAHGDRLEAMTDYMANVGAAVIPGLQNQQTQLRAHVDNHPGGGAGVDPDLHKAIQSLRALSADKDSERIRAAVEALRDADFDI
jgi:hypothetical protein